MKNIFSTVSPSPLVKFLHPVVLRLGPLLVQGSLVVALGQNLDFFVIGYDRLQTVQRQILNEKALNHPQLAVYLKSGLIGHFLAGVRADLV